MSQLSIKNLLATATLATPDKLDEWHKAWRIASASGSQESLLEFVCRESGTSEEVFLQQLGSALGWPFVDLRTVTIPTEARNKISTKVAFQFNALPTDFQNNTLQV